MAEAVRISRKSRNLGYGWTNSVEQRGGRLVLCEPEEEVRGGPRTVLAARAEAQRVNRGNDWRGAYFVGGRRVVAVDEPGYMQVRDLASFLRGEDMFGAAEVVVAVV